MSDGNVEQENMTMNIEETENLPTKEELRQVAPANQQTIDITKNVTTNLGLLVNLKRIVDVCVSRGAFRSEELTQVGTVIDTLNVAIKENVE
tara:strand:- start:1017 stop:1292 length:276 start_codon:yes stop_codon:yes gene_type:complete